jgi:hypothetical protein
MEQIQQERVGPDKRCLLRILQIGGADVAGWYSMGHFARAVVEDPAEAIEATRRWPYLEVVTAAGEFPCDIIIDGDRIERTSSPPVASLASQQPCA